MPSILLHISNQGLQQFTIPEVISIIKFPKYIIPHFQGYMGLFCDRSEVC